MAFLTNKLLSSCNIQPDVKLTCCRLYEFILKIKDCGTIKHYYKTEKGVCTKQ